MRPPVSCGGSSNEGSCLRTIESISILGVVAVATDLTACGDAPTAPSVPTVITGDAPAVARAAGFGIYDPSTRTWKPELRDALLQGSAPVAAR